MGLKVLLVDDDVMIIYLNKMMVEVSGLSSDSVCFYNGKEAFDYLDAHYKAGDSYLILLDINMPVMNGWEFLDSIQTKPFAGSLAVVMVTSSVDKADRERAYQYKQVIDYVEKPLDQETCERIMLLPRLAGFIS